MKISKTITGSSTLTTFNLEGYRPDGVTGNLPCVLFIPGSGECGIDASKLYVNGPLKFILGGWAPSFMVLAAQPIPNYPPSRGDVPYFMRAVLKEITNGSYGVDPKQIVLTGLSYGAATILEYMQYEDAADFIKPIAAIPMSIGWALSGGNDKDNTDFITGNDSRYATIPLIGICGTVDSFYSEMDNFFTKIIAAGYPATFISAANQGHTGLLWNGFYDPTFHPVQLGGKQNIYDSAFTKGNSVSAPPVAVSPPPAPKTIKSILITYTDGTSETKP